MMTTTTMKLSQVRLLLRAFLCTTWRNQITLCNFFAADTIDSDEDIPVEEDPKTVVLGDITAEGQDIMAMTKREFARSKYTSWNNKKKVSGGLTEHQLVFAEKNTLTKPQQVALQVLLEKTRSRKYQAAQMTRPGWMEKCRRQRNLQRKR
jgi:hypothetical protein